MAHNKSPQDVCIISALRTPLGAFQGALASLTATDLGALVIKAVLERAQVPFSAVDEVFMGNVCSANVGQAPATQAMIKAGLPNTIPCTTINKVCASGLKAIMLADQSIRLGQNSLVVAGGMESMSNVPYYLPKARAGLRMGHGEVVDGLIKDGLWDPYSNIHMGSCAELCAAKYNISRDMQDAHAIGSHTRAKLAQERGWAAREILPITLPGGRVVHQDEGTSKLDVNKLKSLRPVFKKEGGGSVTAGNASPMTDGAAAVVLASRARAESLGLPIMAVIRSYADANQAPEWFTTTPAVAIPKAVERAQLQLHDIDYYEINEAFSVVDVANRQLLGLRDDRVNAHGGAVALGHPIGASGARILVTLLNVLRTKGARRGVTAICNGGGGASALVVELEQGGSGPKL
eukprot:CAMPEP_0202892320 /NCGR_PEP_ID=MMETSP1392-20130828/2047_1 /ASSEMBLY_ACC=CAM_ASM_000868 /TAXON_ID=225041 /ORGANISM="Chlamydomonas chlamydogama, Strain SAG 11-48b" /LENGTH=404 /DNA_ID=CAMNT_0049576217 /DNA_START=124 /DNA_END=1338 /DNA_ORIENTATION=+